MPDRSSGGGAGLRSLLLLAGVTLGWLLALLGLDFLLLHNAPGPAFWARVTAISPEDVQAALGNLPEVVVAILGIAITVVSIVLQLAATRYTPRVTEMFFVDRTNLLVIGFFVVTSIQCIWTTVMVHRTFIPYALVLATMLMMSVAILALIPYFAYVFRFLAPENIVARIQQHALAETRGRALNDSTGARQTRVLKGVEQLADVAVNSISQKDRVIASRSVDALRDLVTAYIPDKPSLPQGWFAFGPQLLQNPDFVGMAPRSVEQLARRRTWLEWKVLRQYQTIFNDSLNRMREINQLVAINTRYIGEAAVEAADAHLLHLVIKFFNTYLRATINAKDVRSVYNILHQYRLLGELLLRRGWDADVLEVARRFQYYGLTANACGLSFINETAAYDLCALCELAHEQRFAGERDLLEIALEVDKQPETEAQEQSLRGVRKAQIKLATFYLACGQTASARKIWEDMEHERPERLLSIREEMMAVTEEDFWEVIDRGYNFDFLEPARRERINEFFSWWPHLERQMNSDGNSQPSGSDIAGGH